MVRVKEKKRQERIGHRDTEKMEKIKRAKEKNGLTQRTLRMRAEVTERLAQGESPLSALFSPPLWQIFLPLRGCEEFPIIAGAR